MSLQPIPFVHDSSIHERKAEGAAELDVFVVPFRLRALSRWLGPWRALAAGAPPFAQPAFFLATSRHLVDAEPIFVGVTRGSRLVGALPLMRQGRTLLPLATDHTPRVEYVGERGTLLKAWQGLERMGDWDVLWLRHVRADSDLATTLPGSVRSCGGIADVLDEHRSLYFRLADFEAGLAHGLVRSLKRRADKLPGLRFERVAGFDRRALREAFELERATWRGCPRSAIPCDHRTERFYVEIARHAARDGSLALGFLRVGERRIAMQFALERSGVCYLLKPGYDPEFASFGAGQLMTYHFALDARARGLTSIELLGHDDPWKRGWTNEGHRHVSVACYRGTARGLLRRFLGQARTHTAAVLKNAPGLGAPAAGRSS
jgi:CelD/BcsL family acetyltransferase involved in cellulose biosynthesis